MRCQLEIDTKIKEALEKRAYGFEIEEKEFIKNKNNENTGRIKGCNCFKNDFAIKTGREMVRLWQRASIKNG